MNKAARETVQWEVENVLDNELPDLNAVSEAVQKAVSRELADSLNPLISVNDLAETIMGKVLELLDYDEALGLLKRAYESPIETAMVQRDVRAFLKNHGIEVDDA